MRYLQEYRDGALARSLTRRIMKRSTRPLRLMEICGTHTMAIFRHGIRSLLPESIELLSGPGCPVCVTAVEDIDRCMKTVRLPGVIVTTFGDMLRVPGNGSSLQDEKARGGDVRVVYSILDALKIADENREKQVVFLGIGFETTAPTVAAAIKSAALRGVSNFTVLPAHKLLPPAIHALLSGGDLQVDGFICPGHVTTIIGTRAYEDIAARYRKACVVTGFEPLDILQGILMLVEQAESDRAEVEIQYARGVSREGNPAALRLMEEVFEPCDSFWRGLGVIGRSGLAIRETYAAFDARRRFELGVSPACEPAGCRCAEVLRGGIKPPECGLFGTVCTSRRPVGPCMVSSEGACAAYFRYHA